jgi:hypothetical protein
MEYQEMRRFVFSWVLGILGLFILSGCVGSMAPPEESGYQPLSDLAAGKQAVVRIYAAPIPILGSLIVHTWFAVKSANATSFDRWEVWLTSGEPNGYLKKNFYPVEGNPLAGEGFIVTELIGPPAEPIVDFIVNHSTEYPYMNFYMLIPGPNCNTYTQWVLDNSGWNVAIPDNALGKDFPH